MLPTSLYIHIPWCIRKCPYCDFNSHKSPATLPEENYVDALVADFENDLRFLPQREIATIFIGGGTPSLFAASSYERLFSALRQRTSFAETLEITLEANPGTIEQQRFKEYRQLGINRLSLGVQSFNSTHLRTLGRIHDDQQAHRAIEAARNAGFTNINIDLMHGLPGQTIAQGLADINAAIAHQPEHLSWYQLTIEPNTVFYKQQPRLPNDDEAFDLEEQGLANLAAAGYQRYEISAFCRFEQVAKHNLNYWLFGDYYGIGAGAHGKITLDAQGNVLRTRKQRQPKDYLHAEKNFLAAKETVTPASLPFEFMLNATRLQQAIPHSLFTARTGLPFSVIKPLLDKAAQNQFITLNEDYWQITPFGRQYTNDLQALFLPE